MRIGNFEGWQFYLLVCFAVVSFGFFLLIFLVGKPNYDLYVTKCSDAGGLVVNTKLNTYCIDKKVFINIEK